MVLDSELHLVAQWQTVIANIIILVTVNLVGIFIHNLTEEGQRRAFLDTRDCIAAKLEMEDENEKLVRLNLSSYIGLQNLNLLSHSNATVEPQVRQGQVIKFLTTR